MTRNCLADLCAGSLVPTTAELVLALLPGWQFPRELDSATGFQELPIRRKDSARSAAMERR
jgi:hypothetical protein